MEDDFTDDIFTTGNLTAGIPAFGEVEEMFDEDWFRVELVAGREYRVEVRGSDTGDGTLENPIFNGVYDEFGSFVEGFDDDSGFGLNASYTFIAGGSGTHYFEAGPFSFEEFSGTGTYTIEYFDLSPVDPMLEQTVTLERTVNEGEDITLLIDTVLPSGISLPFPNTGSPDELIAEIDLTGLITTDGATIDEDFTISYEFGQTQVIRFAALPDDLVEDDEGVELRVTGFVDWIVPDSFAEGSIDNILGDPVFGDIERLSIDITFTGTINSAPEGDPAPVTSYTFTEPEIVVNVLDSFADGSEELFSVVPFTFDETLIDGEILANGDFRITDSTALPGQSVVVRFTVEDERGAITNSEQEIRFGALVDDYLPGDTALVIGSIDVGSSEIGSVERQEDVDRFEVFLEAGQRYEINLSSATTLSGILADPEIFGVYDSEGMLVPDSGDDNSGGQNDALVNLIVEESGVYDIEVGSHTIFGTGGYELSVEDLGSADDFLPGQFADSYGLALVDVPTSGIIEMDADRDRFDITLLAGVEYEISLEGSSTGGGSLSNPEIVGVYNSAGALVPGSADNNSGVDTNALVDGLVVSENGTYQIEVASAQDRGVGDYTLTVESVGFVDDYLPGISSALGSVAIGGQATGEIETPGDIDGFAVSLLANTTYEISIRGSDSNSGTLLDPDLFGVFVSSDLSGSPITAVQTLNVDFVGDDSTSYFTPQNAGPFFIGVQDAFGGVGTYTVAVDDIGIRDDFSADIDTTGSIAPGGSAVGRIDFSQDNDWFEVTLAANRLYEIELVPTNNANALEDPFFTGVYDSNGVLIENTQNDDGGTGLGSSLQFVADVSGQYYLSAGGFGDTTGQYRLELNDLGPLDDGAFDITLEFASDDVSNAYINAFDDAVDRWEDIITGDLDYAFVEGYGFVDDVLIEVAIEDIELTFEGVEQEILAISTVLDQRSSIPELPTYSRIVINPDAVGTVRNLDEFVENTIGRALGFGSLWEEFGLVQTIDSVATYVGSNGLREIAELSNDLNGANALEDGADGALAAQYWSEAVFDEELMTPRVELRRPSAGPANPNSPDNPISALTIAAMEDLGYQVDYGEADNFSLNPGALSRQAARVQIEVATEEDTSAKPELQRVVADVPNSEEIPNGAAYIYVRENVLSEDPGSFALNNGNSELVIATGTNAFFIEGVTGENYTVELKGTFTKNDPVSVNQLSGTVDSMDVYSLDGDPLFSVDYSQSPVPVSEVISQWPNYSMDDENVIIVDGLPGTLARINPNGGGENANRIFAGASDDYVRGSNNAEFIHGGGDNDSLVGQGGNDTLIGENGDDMLTGGPGSDVLNGGAGADTAAYSGDQASYTLTLSSESTMLQDRRGGQNGEDTLIKVEFLSFDTNFNDGGPFNLQIFGGPTGLSAPDFESFIELYIAYFNRAPDAVGLNFWGTAFANGVSLENMATLFVGQPETQATYPDGTSTLNFATSVYNNVLGRTPDQSGLDFWANALNSGAVTRDVFILEVLRGAKSDLKPEEGQDFVDQQIADRGYLSNKTDIGAYFAVHKGMSDVDNASAAMAAFDGSNASINAAVSAIDGFYNSALNANNGEFLMPVIGVLDDPFAV